MRYTPSKQIKDQLLRCILEGQFPADRPLPRIKDLADTLKVSTATVQKAIHLLRAEGVIESTRGKGVFINPELFRRKTGSRIGLVFFGNEHYLKRKPYPKDVIDALESGLGAKNLKLEAFCFIQHNPLTLLDQFRKKRLSGLILFEIDADSLILSLRDLRLPMVSMDYDALRFRIPSVVFDNRFGAFSATKHLIKLGHRRITFLLSIEYRPAFQSTYNSSDLERMQGYQLAMADAGLKPDIIEFEQKGQEGGLISLRKALKDALRRAHSPTGYICSHDIAATQLSHEIEKKGLRVPADVSVFGFGDEKLEFAPNRKVSTFRPDMKGMGRIGAQLFLETMDREKHSPPSLVTLPNKMKLRDSVAPPPK